jgi:CheY-like chemotaxis protein
MNLIINARDAIDNSGVIAITTKNVVLSEDSDVNGINIPPGSYTQLSVNDTGCGMEEEVIQHIFEPFYTTKGPGKGTGLGLAVVYGVVKSHNGIIYCESELKKGTTFHILFPALVDKKAQKVIEPPQRKQLPTGTETILLVDDERSILDICEDVLTLYGYRIMKAENGEQAVKIYQAEQNKIQLVLLDLIMPGRGGKKCLEDLISINPQARILMSSGYSTSQQIEELMKTGAAGFISKPYHPEDLLLTVRKLIDKN